MAGYVDAVATVGNHVADHRLAGRNHVADHRLAVRKQAATRMLVDRKLASHIQAAATHRLAGLGTPELAAVHIPSDVLLVELNTSNSSL